MFPDKIIGVHIRRTDNVVAIKESSLDLFISKIRLDLARDPDMYFFLATDDPNVENELISLFKTRIICTNKKFTRSSRDGIIGAMVDLYCLAATTKIYGSYWSSFSSVAASIGNVPLQIVKR